MSSPSSPHAARLHSAALWTRRATNFRAAQLQGSLARLLTEGRRATRGVAQARPADGETTFRRPLTLTRMGANFEEASVGHGRPWRDPRGDPRGRGGSVSPG